MMNKLVVGFFFALSLFSHRSDAETLSYECKTQKHLIKIVKTSDAVFEYKSWNLPQTGSDKPDVDIQQKNAADLQGTGVCSSTFYVFNKEDVEYAIQDNLNCAAGHPPKNARGELVVKIKGQEKDHYWCLK
jgi:hypothetical protein